MHNFERFNLGDMAECTGAIRRLGSSKESFDVLAQAIVDYFYEHLLDGSGKTLAPWSDFSALMHTGLYRQSLKNVQIKPFRQIFASPP